MKRSDGVIGSLAVNPANRQLVTATQSKDVTTTDTPTDLLTSRQDEVMWHGFP